MQAKESQTKVLEKMDFTKNSREKLPFKTIAAF